MRAALLDLSVAVGGQHRILEEGAGVGQRVGIRQLAAAQADDRPAHVGDRRLGNRHSCQFLAHSSVLQVQPRPLVQAQAHLGDQHPVAQGVLEHAVAVAERAGGGVHGARLAAGQRHRLQVDEHVGELCPVGADVLNRRRSHRAGDQAQVLDAAPAARHGERHQALPVVTGRRRHRDRLGILLHCDIASVRHDHDAGEVGGEQDVAAAAEHHARQAGEARAGEQVGQLARHRLGCGAADAHQVARRGRHPQRVAGGQRDVRLDPHRTLGARGPATPWRRSCAPAPCTGRECPDPAGRRPWRRRRTDAPAPAPAAPGSWRAPRRARCPCP